MACRSFALALAALALAASVAGAHAAQRTFVATTGHDANPCSRVAPCRSFGQAIAATDANGEIVVLDSGGYGGVTIDKSVTIRAPAGIYAGISVFTGNDGVKIATAGIAVALRGLTINGQGGHDGIALTAASAIEIERCDVAHMGGRGVYVAADGADVTISETSVHDNAGVGLWVQGQSSLLVARARVENNVGYGLYVQDTVSASIADSLVAGNANTGVLFANQLNGATMTLALSGSRIHANALNGVAVATGVPGTLRFALLGNLISRNAAYGVLASAGGGGTVVGTLARSTIAHNGNSGALVNAGAVLNVADNDFAANGNYGVQRTDTGVLNSVGDNVARDNASGSVGGAISNTIGGV